MKNVEDKTVKEFRRFNRFYTNVLGFLNEHIYDSPFSLTETRILYEIYNSHNCTAKKLQEHLGLDRGYVSRIIKKFEKENIIYKQKCKEDGRNYLVYLTTSGVDIYKNLEKKANQQVEYILKGIDDKTRGELIDSMQVIECILSQNLNSKGSTIFIKDSYTPEDIKIMIEKQRAFFMDTYGWDDTFLDYLYKTFEGDIEKIWIAESDGDFVGCVGLVKHDEKTAQLRWFLVETAFRKGGTGTKLIHNLIDYCKEKRYERVFLWTVSNITAARALYEKFGFKITEVKEEQMLWGQKLVEERWDLML
ncbi:bifunctional helix-turn-helix transcriptional regulator/GNAT family N-acetyltransferase [Bacillus sp. PK3_68]|uniref:bifunctional helix-turn-helix transcriptional regulator/GNAT family N-acetyltransferase n=1 Tax=Bacillus sp. PK3_68 TaxID=2027408 RepID=UPI000E7736B9|nr:bifunctional helix-turn-helix transcriptional regulator/GNAT family N-acetyltransferase [Bacillus sp. PK3_68]RJS59159.1 MarR family transcriptional regulator [Bacillus sp. PK3_68]